MTRVRMRTTFGPVEYWSCDVAYDAWGQPYAKGWGMFFGLFGPLWASSDMLLNKDGTTQGRMAEWKHESGAPVDFTRIDRSWK